MLTHVAKVASSPTMFGDQWEFCRTRSPEDDSQDRLIAIGVYDGHEYHLVKVYWVAKKQSFELVGQFTFLQRAQYFVDRLNELKRDEQGNMR